MFHFFTKLPSTLMVIAGGLLLTMFSCVPQKKLMYFLDETADSIQHIENKYNAIYTVKPNDLIYIRVAALDEKTSSLFSMHPANYSQYLNNEMSVYLNSYSVDPDGYIEFPVVGKIYVKDKTLGEVKQIVQTAIDEYIVGGSVIVKLINYKVSVLGEVNRPGRFLVYQEQMNIFEAIAMAGDMTPWGNRKNVQIIRKTNTGSTVFNIDLTNRGILASEAYYLMPDDIVYVTPMNAKTFAFTTFPYQVVFSTITTALLIMNYFK